VSIYIRQKFSTPPPAKFGKFKSRRLVDLPAGTVVKTATYNVVRERADKTQLKQ